MIFAVIAGTYTPFIVYSAEVGEGRSRDLRVLWVEWAVALAGMGLSLGGMVLFYGLIRCGWSRGRADPSLTEPQMLYALASGAAAYAMVGAGRGGVFPIVMVILAFGMFQLRPAQVRRVSLYNPTSMVPVRKPASQ